MDATAVDTSGVAPLQSLEESPVEVTKDDKELSWEKIAAEIAEGEIENDSQEVHHETPEVEETPAPEQVQEAAVVSEEAVEHVVNEEQQETSISIVEEETFQEKEPKLAEPLTDSNDEHITEEQIVDDIEEQAQTSEVAQVENGTPEQLLDSVPAQEEQPPAEVPQEPLGEVQEATTTSCEESSPAEPLLSEEVISESQISEPQLTEEPKTAEVVEITEMKHEETVAEVEPVAEEVEYTVLEEEELEESNEVIEEHLAQTNTGETVVIINPDETRTEIRIEQMEDERAEDRKPYTEDVYVLGKDSELVDDPSTVQSPEPQNSSSKPRKPRGRKPITDIPLHVLGRDISKPSEGISNGGRTMPKPRLGVKVPYRNLTSQIVSKEEIEKEIMERFKLKQEQNAQSSADLMFARKLTQRLAKKLIPNEKDADGGEGGSSQEDTKSGGEIKNNSDLIAILEGDGEEIEVTKQKPMPFKEMSKETEKEIALKQLQEFSQEREREKEQEKEKEKQKQKDKDREKEKEKDKKQPEVKKEKRDNPSPVKIVKSSTSSEKKVDVEPRLKTGMVIKTYTRKRKSNDAEPTLPPKKTVVATAAIKTEESPNLPMNAYVTKSSRVIKKKVIWDPDEVPIKSPIKSPKAGSPARMAPKPAVEKKLEVEKSPEKKIKKEKEAVSKTPPPSSPSKKPKRLTEVDKLLMDEGAVNMLYDVTATEEDKTKKKNKPMINLDKAAKELMSKASVIKNDLQQHSNKENQKSLRKKELASPPKKELLVPPSPVPKKKPKEGRALPSPGSSPSFNAAEASRIIRRHSSSSFSSSDELGEKKSGNAGAPLKKKARKSSDAKPTKEVVKNNNNTVPEPKVNNVEKTQNKSFTFSRRNKIANIKLNSVNDKCYLTEQVLKDLTSCLKDMTKDEDCHVVSITSDKSESFCHGLDYSCLVNEDEIVRKKKASEFATLVKDFLRCLLNFPKVLIAGIQGECVGLGVTMLPLFDMVVASDTSTFSTPYARLGCVAEAGFLLTVPHINGHGLAGELLYTSQTIKADDAFRRGLVTKLCWPEKYHEELKGILAGVTSHSIQSIVATKQQLRQHIQESTETALSSINKVLVDHWTSDECQKSFAK